MLLYELLTFKLQIGKIFEMLKKRASMPEYSNFQEYCIVLSTGFVVKPSRSKLREVERTKLDYRHGVINQIRSNFGRE